MNTTLDKLNNGCYVLARNENIVLAYHREANEFVTWLIDDDDTQQTIDGGYYSTVEHGVDCYFKRAGINASSSHRSKLINFIKVKLVMAGEVQFILTANGNRIFTEWGGV